LLAVPAGLADWSDIKRDKPAWKIGLYHLILNLVVVALWAVNFGLRWWGPTLAAAAVPAIPLTLSVVGTLLLFISGYLGGKMTYDYGINVARTSKQKWRRIAEAGGAKLPSE
jgi:uncharacterized membrane protein